MDTAASTAIVETSFNSDFYVAASTIIPVLFIALAVQVPLFAQVFVAYQGFAHIRAEERTARMFDRGGLGYRVIFSVSSWLLICGLALILAAGVLGELLAFYALYQQQAQSSTRDIVFWLTIVLIFGVPAGAIATFVGGVYNTRPPKTDDQATDEGLEKPELASDTESAAASTSNMPDEGSDNPSTQ